MLGSRGLRWAFGGIVALVASSSAKSLATVFKDRVSGDRGEVQQFENEVRIYKGSVDVNDRRRPGKILYFREYNAPLYLWRRGMQYEGVKVAGRLNSLLQQVHDSTTLLTRSGRRSPSLKLIRNASNQENNRG